MKKLLSAVICLAIFVMMLPVKQVSAYNTTSYGTIESGREYYGETPINDGGNHIPIRFELPVAENSMVRLIMYTQTESDTSLYIENESGPYDLPDSYGRFGGRNLTAIGDFYNPVPNVYGSSTFSVTADKRNTNEYTEVFGDLAAGNYYIVVVGASYRFKVILEPLTYYGTVDYSNDTKETAKAYTIGNEQEGVLVTNGVINGEYLAEEKTVNSWYKFTGNKGKYQLKLFSDGFFQGTASVLNSEGYQFTGSYDRAEAYFTFSTGDTLAANFNEHLSKTGSSFAVNFELPEDGTYYININKKPWTSGSYKFQVIVDGDYEDTSGEDATEEAETTLSAIKIDPAKASVKVGSTVTLKANAFYSDNVTEDISEFVTWYCSNTKVATVDEIGIVKGVAAGTAVIVASLEGKESSITVTVTASEKITKIVPQKATLYMKVGATATNKITAYYGDKTKKIITTKATYKSSSTNLKVASNGLLKATKKGNYTITVTYNSKKTSFKVVVK